LSSFNNAYLGRRVLVTGHTGFKGSWLSLWLDHLGAEVTGYSLAPLDMPSMFELTSVSSSINDHLGDIRDSHRLAQVVDDCRPEIVFHLAAQSLVIHSYHDPIETLSTNVMGTANLLDCVRHRPWITAVVIVTSDKVYKNEERTDGYKESDKLGGNDTYSASKACVELVTNAYHRSFLHNSPTQVATARAGNVIGGGDWAINRIVPDAIRAWSDGVPLLLRNPGATRPWQHVLEPSSGYLRLGAGLLEAAPNLDGSSFNFGPPNTTPGTVADLVDAMADHWPNAAWETEPTWPITHPETTLLHLDCDKARDELEWHGALDISEAITHTMAWYQCWHHGRKDLATLTLEQIGDYCSTAASRGLGWAQ